MITRLLPNALTDNGYGFVLCNMRASYNNPYAEYSDAVKDIAAFVAYAKSKGYARIAILGISLGGPRMAQYVAERNDPAVKAVGFIASIPSPYLEFQIRSSEADKQRLEDTLAQARELVVQGKGQEPVAFANWFPGAVSVMGKRKVSDQLLRSAERSERAQLNQIRTEDQGSRLGDSRR